MSTISMNQEIYKNDQRNQDKLYIYGRYYAKIPGYIKKALKIVHNYHDSLHAIFPKLETPLLYISLACVVNEIRLDYVKIKHKNEKYRTYFLVDQAVWHLLSSFVIPSLSLSNMIHYFIIFSEKLIKNQRLLKLTCGVTSGLMVYSIMNPIDKVSNIIMDNTFRRVINYKNFDDEKEILKEEKRVLI